MPYNYTYDDFYCEECKETVDPMGEYCKCCGAKVKGKVYPTLDLVKTEFYDCKDKIVYTHDILKTPNHYHHEVLFGKKQYTYLEVVKKGNKILGKVIFIDQRESLMRISGCVGDLVDLEGRHFQIIGNARYNPMCWKEDLNKGEDDEH